MVKKIGEDRFPKRKTRARAGARPRTIPRTEEERQHRLRLMREIQKKSSKYIKENELNQKKPSWLFWFWIGFGLILFALILIALMTMI